MTGKTHAAAGVAAALMLGANAPQIAIIVFGSLLPDIDHSGSTLGRLVKPLSKSLKHRSVTHSLLFLLISTILSPYLGIGVLTHILLDMLNPEGVRLFFPYKKKMKVPIISKFVKTGSGWETVIFALLVIGCIAILINYQNLWGYTNIMKFTTLWYDFKWPF